MHKIVEFNGTRILLIAEDFLADLKEVDESDVVIRICKKRLPNVPGSPGAIVIKLLKRS